MRRLITVDGRRSEVSVEEVRSLLRDGKGTGFWLDFERPGEEDYELLLNDFGFHPLTVEDLRLQNQRPKLDEFPGYAFAVLFCAGAHGDELVFKEQHLYLSPRWLVSVHQEPSDALEELRQRIAEDPELVRGDVGFLKYLVINRVVEDLFPVLDQLDETIDQLEDGIVAGANRNALARIATLKHEVTDLRRMLGPQRDVFQRMLTHSLDHEPNELSLYWRDVYEHLVRQYEQVDSLRDLLTGTMDVYLSTESNRLNTTVKQLTVIASIFLPLTFLTGFFGMNFPHLVRVIDSPAALAMGVALMVGTVALQLLVFRLRGWI